MAEYIALIHKEPETGFGASFPDFPCAVTVSSTLEELRGMAEEVLAFHIEGMVEDGYDIPAATSFDVISKSSDFEDAVAVLVIKAPETASMAVRINITVPDHMLKRIDNYAAAHGLTRSGFLVNAAKREMESQLQS
jgi:predicted RNase H-like HicB family nuclease